MDPILYSVIAALSTLGYLTIGIGISKMLAQLKGGPLSLLHLCFWPIVAVVFAAADDVAY